MGLVNARQGEIMFEGQLDHRDARRTGWRTMGIGYVPEDRRIFRLLTVMENLRTGFDRQGVTEERKKALLDKVFAYFPVLAERRNQAGGTLSGGEQQMLGDRARDDARAQDHSARRADRRPDAAHGVADPPDHRRAAREGVAILLVEQNVPLTLEASQRIYIMEKGMVRHHCATSEITIDDPVIKQYLGV